MSDREGQRRERETQRKERIGKLEVMSMVVCSPRPPSCPTPLSSKAHRESSTPGSDVDGVLLFTDTLQTGQGRLFRAVTSSGTRTLPTAPVRSPSIRGAPSWPSWLPRLLLLPPLQGNAQGQILGEMVHRGIPSCLHVSGAGKRARLGHRKPQTEKQGTF